MEYARETDDPAEQDRQHRLEYAIFDVNGSDTGLVYDNVADAEADRRVVVGNHVVVRQVDRTAELHGTVRTDEMGRPIVHRAECATCGARWNDAVISLRTPTPSGRCPWEAEHRDAPSPAPGGGTAQHELTISEIRAILARPQTEPCDDGCPGWCVSHVDREPDIEIEICAQCTGSGTGLRDDDVARLPEAQAELDRQILLLRAQVTGGCTPLVVIQIGRWIPGAPDHWYVVQVDSLADLPDDYVAGPFTTRDLANAEAEECARLNEQHHHENHPDFRV